MQHTKYCPYPAFFYEKRTWPGKIITKSPIWCSVDLRDGNQALETPMTLEQKVEFFGFLVKMGFKEIEIGFPAASDTEYQFARLLIEQDLIPDDVTIQVLTQSREHIIRRTFEALKGAKKSIVHLYNSTSTLQRQVVFGMEKEEIKKIAVDGAKLLVELSKEYGEENFLFEYSPESFTGTEMDFAVDICNAVLEEMKPTPERKVIINLPSTVEMHTPNVYADQIEFMCNSLICRENVIVSVHTHNDRGTGVASSELAVLAGADRVEGTLFGNGERTGNADLLTIALNIYSHGIDPGIDFSKIQEVVDIYEKSTGQYVHPRHPYAGELVFTAFSGSHQDAIKKGFNKLGGKYWQVPYLPIDPVDIGRTYDPVIRINSQSGKSGVAFIIEKNYGLKVPKPMVINFGKAVTDVSDKLSKELSAAEIYQLFADTYINKESRIALVNFKEYSNGDISVTGEISVNGEQKQIEGTGNGLLSAFSQALTKELGITFEIVDYSEHSLEYGTSSRAMTYIEITDKDGKHYFGAGMSRSITKSSIKALISAVNNCII